MRIMREEKTSASEHRVGSACLGCEKYVLRGRGALVLAVLCRGSSGRLDKCTVILLDDKRLR